MTVSVIRPIPHPGTRRFGVALAVLLTAAACSDPPRPTLGDDTLPTVPEMEDAATDGVEDDAGTAVDAEADLAAEESDVVEIEGPARALITPTGVVVPVISELSDSYSILTPCGNRARIDWGTPIRSADIAIDPGHGGDIETGAVGPNGLTEKELNLDLARRTAAILEERGISVVLTRTWDYRVPLSVRAEIANQLDVEAIISIHHNAPNANPSDVPGTEVFIQDGVDESARLGGILQEEIVAALEQYDIDWTSANDAGAIAVINADGDNAYGMIRRPDMPAVLAELGYLSNPQEAALFETEDYRDTAATALADGIERWLTTDDPGSGFRDEPRRFTPSGGTGGPEGCVDPELQ